MTTIIHKYKKQPVTVDAAQYDGWEDSRKVILSWIQEHEGLGFSAAELLYRHDMGCYWHPEHGFVYLPAGARVAGSAIERLRDDELIVRTDGNSFAVVFPGDYVVRSRSGFYPLRAESFHRSYRPNIDRRGTGHPALSPAV